MKPAMIHAMVCWLAAGAAAAQVLVEHDYDALGDRVTTLAVLAGERATQGFDAPAGGGAARVVRLKLRRVGEPGPLLYRAGSRPGAADLGSGELAAAAVQPFFERFTTLSLKGAPLEPGRRYYVQISRAAGGSGYYEWYGTTARGEESAINQDYGAVTPIYAGGEALDAADRPVEGLNLAFQVLGPEPTSAGVEESFRFMTDLLAEPHYRRTRDWQRRAAGPGEVALSGPWSVELLPGAGRAARTAAAELRAYLREAMGIEAGGGGQRIVAGTVADLPAYRDKVARSEAFVLEVVQGRVTVAGYDDRGVMRGLYHVQDLLDLRQAPVLKAGTFVRAPRYSPRITCAPLHAGLELEPESDPYTAGLLQKIARAGYNALYVWGKLYELGRSEALPELGAEAPARLARLNALIERAAAHGIDVYLYVTLDPLAPAFFEKHPDARGVPRDHGPFYGTPGFLLCTSAPVVQRYIEEATASIFHAAPGLKGAIMIPYGEGLTNCRTGGANVCPRCSNRARDEVLAEAVTLVARGAHRASPKAEIATWTYTWPENDPSRAGLIARMPKDMVWLATFEKEGVIERDGVHDAAYDYTISYLGPAENFRRQLPLVEKAGLRLWVKTESMISQEFVQAPYIPVYQRWVERYRRIAAVPRVSGIFLNWNHNGFMPSRAAELVKWYTWEPLPEGDLPGRMARRDFGERAGPLFVEAWDRLSHAISYFPLSDNTSRNGPAPKGPAHPFFADPAYRPRHNARRQFFNSLNWTLPWDVPVARKYFGLMEAEWARGVELLHRAAAAAEARDRVEAEREVGVAEMQLSCIRMVLNLIEFYSLRGQVESAADPREVRRRMAAVLARERENSLRALRYVEADSRLGYANGGNGITNGGVRAGIFTAASIRKKLSQIERVRRELE